MIRRLPLVVVFAALGAVLRAEGSPPQVTPIIHFADPADMALITVAHASLSRVTGTGVNAGSPAARVDFEFADWPELAIRPAKDPADWSGAQALAIPVDNPAAEPVDLVVRVDDDLSADGNEHSLTGRARVGPGKAVTLILPLQPADALPMGMRAGPPLVAPRLDTPVRVIGGRRGTIDRRHISAVRLILLRRSAGRTLIFGDPGIIRGADPGPEAYRRIVDGFGQYTHAQWDGKIGSDKELQRAGRREEEQLRAWLSALPPVDRYGGLLEGPSFRATAFFRTERRAGRWWLVTPEATDSFRSGSTS
jgi:hypothetical protein